MTSPLYIAKHMSYKCSEQVTYQSTYNVTSERQMADYPK